MAQPGLRMGKNAVTLMKGTPNQKTFYLERPGGKLSENDITKIKQAYGIPQDFTLEQTRSKLKEIEQADRASILGTIPFDKGTQQYYGELAEKTADALTREELIEDPINFYSNQAIQQFGKIKLPFGYAGFPKDLISKETVGMVGGMSAVAGVDALNKVVQRNPFAVLTPQQLYGAEVLGTAAGETAYNLGNNILRGLLDLPVEDLKTQSSQFLYDSMLNTMFTGGAAAMGPVFNNTKAFIGKNIFGVKPSRENLQKIRQINETYGMPLGIVQATNMPFWKAYSKVIGIMPWIGTEFGRMQQAGQEGARQYLGKLMNSLAPLQTVTMLGKDLKKMMGANYESVRAAQKYLYQNFEEYAEKLKGKKVIKIDNFKQLANDTYTAYTEGIPGVRNGMPFRFPGSKAGESFGQLYNLLRNLDSDITLDQAITLRQMFNDFSLNFKKEFGAGNIPESQANNLHNLAQMLEYDLTNLKNIDNEIDDVVFNTALKKLSTANEYFSATIPDFTGGVATNIKQINQNIFGPGPDQKYGMMYTKEAFDMILQRAKKDPEAMGHLLNLSKATPEQIQAYKKAGNKEGVMVDIETLVKNEDIKSPNYGKFEKKTIPVMSVAPNAGQLKIVRRLFGDAINKAITGLPAGTTPNQYLNVGAASPEMIAKKGLKGAAPEMLQFKDVEFNITEFQKALGLDTEDGIEVLEQALKGTGVSIPGINRFLEAAEMAGSFDIGDPSTFVTRRVTLGGLKSMMLFQGASAAGLTAINPIMTALFLKYGSKFLTDPKNLKAFTEVLEDAVKFPTKDPLTKSRRNDILEWASKVLPTDDELEEQDFMKEIDQSVLSLIMTPQSQMEQEVAREKQLELMTSRPRGEDYRTMEEIDRRIQDNVPGAFNVDVPLINPADAQQIKQQQSQLGDQTRQELAFGTLDDALAAQKFKRGIGGL